MSSKNAYVTAAFATAGVVAGYCAYRYYQESNKLKIPTKWKQVGTLQDLYVYPIKSCGPVILESAECTNIGLRSGWLRDRFLMVIDERYNFVTARTCPDLLTVHPQVRSSILTLNHEDMETIHVNLAEVVALQSPKIASVWSTPVPVFDCGSEANEWFSRLIDKSSDKYRLVYYASQQCRSLRSTTNKFYKFTKNDTGAFPDEVSFHLINEASVEDLNKRLVECQVSHRNFRPNFVLKGANPYDEDKWKFVKIGENVFEIIKPCTRCILTTIDPETGVRNPKEDPLKTLKTYRQIEDPEERRTAGSSPRFGIQMALRSAPGGLVSLNDPIYVA